MCRPAVLSAFLVIATWICSADGYYYASKFKSNWQGANEACYRAASRLAVIDNKEKQSALEEYLRGNGLGQKYFWVALNDLAVAKKFVWSSNGQPAGYTNWLTGQPKSRHKCDDHCVQITTDSPNSRFRWTEAKCSEEFYFLCESY